MIAQRQHEDDEADHQGSQRGGRRLALGKARPRREQHADREDDDRGDEPAAASNIAGGYPPGPDADPGGPRSINRGRAAVIGRRRRPRLCAMFATILAGARAGSARSRRRRIRRRREPHCRSPIPSGWGFSISAQARNTVPPSMAASGTPNVKAATAAMARRLPIESGNAFRKGAKARSRASRPIARPASTPTASITACRPPPQSQGNCRSVSPEPRRATTASAHAIGQQHGAAEAYRDELIPRHRAHTGAHLLSEQVQDQSAMPHRASTAPAHMIAIRRCSAAKWAKVCGGAPERTASVRSGLKACQASTGRRLRAARATRHASPAATAQ